MQRATINRQSHVAIKPLTFVAASFGPAAELELLSALKIWTDAQTTLALAIDAERAARTAIVEKYFTDKSEGTHTGSLRESHLKCTFPISRSVDQEQFAAADAFANNADAPEALRERLRRLLSTAFRAKQEVSVKEWKALSDDDRKFLADIVTEKPGTPQLKLEPKKN